MKKRKAPARHRKGSKKQSTVQADVLSFLQSKRVDSAADYVQRGRRHQALTDQELRTAWKAAFRIMANDPWNEAARRDDDDLSAEFDFRGQQPPLDEVKEDIDRLIAITDKAARQTKADPADWKRANAELQWDIDEHKAKRDFRKN